VFTLDGMRKRLVSLGCTAPYSHSYILCSVSKAMPSYQCEPTRRVFEAIDDLHAIAYGKVR